MPKASNKNTPAATPNANPNQAPAPAPAPPPVAADPIQTTLQALRIVRMRLYAVPGATVAAMSLPDQIKYGDNIQRVGTSILKLEAARLQELNAAFSQQEGALAKAGAQLQHDTDTLTDSVQLIRTVSSGLTLVTNIVGLLG